mgnify:FL=1
MMTQTGVDPEPAVEQRRVRLAGRRAVITGGASGIGAACARLFAAEGASVVLADLEGAREQGEELAEQLPAAMFANVLAPGTVSV